MNKILSYTLFHYRQKKSFKSNKISLWQNIQQSISFSAARIAITKATEYVTFGSSFGILVFSLF